jgi:hypothetical protein
MCGYLNSPLQYATAVKSLHLAAVNLTPPSRFMTQRSQIFLLGIADWSLVSLLQIAEGSQIFLLYFETVSHVLALQYYLSRNQTMSTIQGNTISAPINLLT